MEEKNKEGQEEVLDGQIGLNDLIFESENNKANEPVFVPPIKGQVSIYDQVKEKPKIPNLKKEKDDLEKFIRESREFLQKNKQVSPKIILNEESKDAIKQISKKKNKTLGDIIKPEEEQSKLFSDIHGLNKKGKEMEEVKKTKLNGNSSNGGSDKYLYKTVDEVLHESMIPYSEHVILDRALPRVEDGLKPVQRRILFSMMELGVTPDKPHRKSARIVGDCMGKYHPHGDRSVYDTMVRLAQAFNTNATLVDGHGNFGSVDGDSAAAMRYTEARLTPLAMELLRDLEKDTVKWSLNFDDTLKEPDLLPGRYPNLLVNGCQGIAVGLATNIPPHNLGEVIDGVIAYIDNNHISLAEMLKIIKGPDFPTGAYILNGEDLAKAYETGKGRVIIRAKINLEISNDKKNIVITEMPYQTNKVALLQKIADLRETNKALIGISDIRDESDRNGIRAVIKLKKDASVKSVLEALYKSTDLQTTFGINMVAIADGKPKQLSLMEIINYYVKYQRQIIFKRSRFELEQAKEREHILSGLITAILNINEVIKIIKSSKSTAEAKEGLKKTFDLSDIQCQAILDMRLSRLTGLETIKLQEEISELKKRIKKLTEIMNSEKLQYEIVKTELLEIRKQFKKDRQTTILKNEKALHMDIVDTDNPPKEELIIGYSALSNIKAMPKKHFNLSLKEFNDNSSLAEVHSILCEATSDQNLLIFSDIGNCYKFSASKIPETRFKDKGISVEKVIPGFTSTEKIVAIIPDSVKDKNLLFITKNGMVKKSLISEYFINKQMYQALKLKDDMLLNVVVETEGNLLFVTKEGLSLKTKLDDMPLQNRLSQGVKGIALNEGDEVLYADICSKEDKITLLTDTGNAKKIMVSNIDLSQRNRKGVKLIGSDSGKKIVCADLKDNFTFIVPIENGFIYKKSIEVQVENRLSKGKSISKKKLNISQACKFFQS